MNPQELQEMLDEIGALLRARLGAQGASLAAQSQSVQERVPRRLRADLAALVAVEPRAAHPKLALKTDLAPLRKSHARLKRGLNAIPKGMYTKRARSALIAQIAFQILVVLVLFLVVLRWRDLI